VRPKVDERAGQLILPHVGISNTERKKMEIKYKNRGGNKSSKRHRVTRSVRQIKAEDKIF